MPLWLTLFEAALSLAPTIESDIETIIHGSAARGGSIAKIAAGADVLTKVAATAVAATAANSPGALAAGGGAASAGPAASGEASSS